MTADWWLSDWYVHTLSIIPDMLFQMTAICSHGTSDLLNNICFIFTTTTVNWEIFVVKIVSYRLLAY